MEKNFANAIREIATCLQVGDTVRAHAMMEMVAIYEGVETSSVYAAAEKIAEDATRLDIVARELSVDSLSLHAFMRRLNNIRPAA